MTIDVTSQFYLYMSDNLSLLETTPRAKQVSILGIPLDLGKDNIGTDAGVGAIRSQGLLEMFEFLKITVRDRGDIACPDRATAEIGKKNLKFLESIVTVAEQSARIVDEEIRNNRVVFALGGDHSVSLGTIAGASAAVNGKLGVIWIDAHGDMMTHENTLSGNIHGMPSAAAFGLGHERLTTIYKKERKVAPENMLYIGLKDLDQGEIDLIRNQQLTAFTIFDILQNGWSPIFTAIQELSTRVDRIWVSLDLDSIDRMFAPGTPMQNNGGLTYREITHLARFIGKNCALAGADIVEYAPMLDVDNKTAKLALELIAALCGTEYGWYQQYMHEEMKKQTLRA